MNPVETKQAIFELAEQPFDAIKFPYSFLMAFGNKDTTIKCLHAWVVNGDAPEKDICVISKNF
jgi:hypothetical protein